MQRKSGLFYGWWVLIACALIQTYFSATFVTGFTALFNPIVDEFGWSYALVSLAFTLRGFEMGFMAPAVGFFVDRYRPQKMLLAGAVLGAIGFFFFSRIQTLWSFYTAFIILGISLSMSSHVVVMTAVATWFKKRTSLAMGILTCGAGASGLLIPAVVWLIDVSGWRRAIEFFGIGALVVCIPLCFLVKDPPGEAYDGQRSQASPTPGKTSGRTAIKEILKKKNFWLLALAVLFSGTANSAVTTHQIPYLISVGITRETAGFMVVVFSLSNVIGRLGFGWLGDNIDKRHCFVFASLIQVGGLAAFAYSTAVAQVIPSLIILGVGLGGIMPLRPGLQLELFGMKAFALVQGLTLVFVTVGSMASPPLAGWFFDVFKNYQPAWLTLAAFTIVAVPIIMTLSKQEEKRSMPPSADLKP